MAIEVDSGSEEHEEESGSSLRSRLEATLAVNRKLEDRVRASEAKAVIAEKGLSLVKPEDLEGVDLDKLEERATQIHNERHTQQSELLRKALESRGFEGDQVEDMVREALGQAYSETPEAKAVERARTLGTVDSQPVPLVDDQNMHGQDAIRAHFEKQERRKLVR